ncbi:MAG: HAD family phosphatase [Oscillospiraceae bacterium]|nr:HAD family phosphatase [Oscillospiraceae bacterium]
MDERMKKACIFDLDGTLLDSMNVWLQIDVDFLKKRGFEVSPDYTAIVSSMNFPEAAAYTKERFALADDVSDIMREWNDMAAYAYANTVKMKPGAKEYLAALKERGAKLAIVTSSVPDLFEPTLRNHGILDWFDVICISEEVGCGKSRPDIFLLAAQKLGVKPSDCIVFEDIIEAVKSAKSIGMTVCGVYDEASHGDWAEIKSHADFTLTDFTDGILYV